MKRGGLVSPRFGTERGVFWPLRSPVHDDAALTEDCRVLRSVVLDDPLETKRLEISLAPIAVEELLAIPLCVRFDLGVEDPFHVLQRQFLGEGPFRRISWGSLTSSFDSGCVFCNLGVKALPNVDKHLGGELGTCIL
jgi:hypothetical protein